MNIILDASAIINGIPINLIKGRLITSPNVIDEIGKRANVIPIERVEQRIPKERFIEKVKKEILKTRDTLSKTDIEIIALALEFKGEIATDDYGIQNIAKKIGINFIPVGEVGIKKVFEWEWYCPACFRKYKGPGVCEVCGTKLKRRVKKS